MNYRLRAFLLCTLLSLSGLFGSIRSAGFDTVQARPQQQNISITSTEGSAMKSLRALLSAETTFQSTMGKGEFGDLKELGDANLIDKDLARGLKDGFRFTVVIKKSTMTTHPAIDLVARPEAYGKEGRRSFYLTESGVMLTSAEKDAPLSSMRPFASQAEEARAIEQNSEPRSNNDLDEEAIADQTASNESSVLASLVTIHSAEVKYIARAGAGAYGTLEQLEKAGFLDKAQSAIAQHGYLFEVKISASKRDSPATFSISAFPQSYGMSGRESYFIDQTGVVRGDDKEGGPADASDPVVR